MNISHVQCAGISKRFAWFVMISISAILKSPCTQTNRPGVEAIAIRVLIVELHALFFYTPLVITCVLDLKSHACHVSRNLSFEC